LILWQVVTVHLKPALISAEIGYRPPEVEVVPDSATVLPLSCLRLVIGELFLTQIPAV
jgi:hypothetical protein